MSLVMLGFGLVVMNGGMPPGSKQRLPETFPAEWHEEIKASAGASRRPSAPAAFQFLWVAGCAGAFLYSVWNLLGEGPATEVITEAEERAPAQGADSRPTRDLLVELEQLRSEQLISESEYRRKREDILQKFGSG